jgi:hypothetical protein
MPSIAMSKKTLGRSGKWLAYNAQLNVTIKLNVKLIRGVHTMSFRHDYRALRGSFTLVRYVVFASAGTVKWEKVSICLWGEAEEK